MLTVSDGRYTLRARADLASGRGVLANLKDSRNATDDDSRVEKGNSRC